MTLQALVGKTEQNKKWNSEKLKSIHNLELIVRLQRIKSLTSEK